MAVNIDTVYQKVLAIANKEQRGYVTPQEFNLFANQAQMDIFEQYFYDKNQYNRLPKDNTPYGDLNHLLEEKISIFKRRQRPVTITNEFGDGTLPSDVYRLDSVLRLALTDVSGSYANTIEEVTEDELLLFDRAPLSRPTPTRPIYSRTSATGIKIKPHSATPSASAAPYFNVTGFDVISGDSTTSISTSVNNYNFIEPGQEVINSVLIPSNTFVGSVNNGVVSFVDSNGAAVDAIGNNGSATLTFATDDIKCNYIRKPATVSWNYVEINGVAMYNSANSVDFELHPSEENNLILKILQLAGVSIESIELYQVASQEEIKNIQQEKI
jgi:hypothetical protein